MLLPVIDVSLYKLAFKDHRFAMVHSELHVEPWFSNLRKSRVHICLEICKMLYWVCNKNLSFSNLQIVILPNIELKLPRFENKVSKKRVQSGTKLMWRSHSLQPVQNHRHHFFSFLFFLITKSMLRLYLADPNQFLTQTHGRTLCIIWKVMSNQNMMFATSIGRF